MEAIEHKYVEVNGLKLHIAEIGSGNTPVVLFLHGFPEIWYSWRHQMIAVAKAGYRAIAPDFRGYGLSGQPSQPEKTTFLDLVNDILALLDALNISKVFLVGKDFGSIVLSRLVTFYKDRVSGFVVMGVPFLPLKPLEFKQGLPEGFYISRFGEPGRAEADFGRLDTKTVVRNVYILFSRSEIPIANENQEIMDIVQPSTPLPPWFSEEDLAAYGALYDNSGFQTALQVPYRSLHEQVNITDPTVHVPALFVKGEKDYFLKFPGIEDYISSGLLKSLVPNLQIVNLPEGNHFVQEQLPDKVFLVGKDFGTIVISRFVTLYEERVSGFVVIGVPFLPPGPLEFKGLPEGFYVSRFGEPGRAEADFDRLDAKTIVRNVYILFSRSEIPIANENQEVMDIVQPSTPLPPWFSEEDLAAYGALYENSGFRTALQVPYRSLHEQVNVTDPTVHVPALFIKGEKDYFLKFPGTEDYISSGLLKSLVPNLQIVNLPEGTHFVQQLPHEVNQLVLEFLTKNSKPQ